MIRLYITNLLDWGWTQAELAESIEVSQATISRWSKGQHKGVVYERFQKAESLWKKEKKKYEKRNRSPT